MVGTIGFAGSKARQRGTSARWAYRIGGPHVLASGLGGFVLGLLVSWLGALVKALISAPRPALLAVFGVAAAAELSRVPARYLARSRQVPLSWKHMFPAPMSATLYGLVLGFGVSSTVYFWSFHALLLSLFIVGDLSLGIVAGLSFGLARAALPTLAGVFFGERSVERHVDQMALLMSESDRLIHLLSAVVIGLLAWSTVHAV